jgi:hypothetical protein
VKQRIPLRLRDGDLLLFLLLLRLRYPKIQNSILHGGLHAFLINRLRKSERATEFSSLALRAPNLGPFDFFAFFW